MRHIVHRLRQKPHHHRHAVAITVSFIVTGMIFAIWLTARMSTWGTGTDGYVVSTDTRPLEVMSNMAAPGAAIR